MLAVMVEEKTGDENASAASVTATVSLFSSCHKRLVDALRLSEAIRLSKVAGPEEIGMGARRVTRFFDIALPLHEADEELSLLPRLVAVCPEAGALSQRISREHREIEPTVARWRSLWQRVVEAPHELERLREELGQLGLEVSVFFLSHIQFEESEVLPLIEHLSEAERDAIAIEARARRTPEAYGVMQDWAVAPIPLRRKP